MKKLNEETVRATLKANRVRLSKWFESEMPELVAWCKQHGGWARWRNMVGIKTKRSWDEEQALAILKANKKQSYIWFKREIPGLVTWLSQNGGWRKWADSIGIKNAIVRWTPERVIALFKANEKAPMQWFYDKYPGMICWCYANGGIRKWKKKGGRKTRRLFNEETVTAILRKNKKMPETWFRTNESSVVAWCDRNGGFEKWMDKVGIEHKEILDEKTVLATMKKYKDKPFSWFRSNEGSVVYWVSQNGGWRKWAAKAGVKTASKARNRENVIEELKKYRGHSLVEINRADPPLARWCYRNGGLRELAKEAGVV